MDRRQVCYASCTTSSTCYVTVVLQTRLVRLAQLEPPGAEPHDGARHEHARGRHAAHDVQRPRRLRALQRRARHRHLRPRPRASGLEALPCFGPPAAPTQQRATATCARVRAPQELRGAPALLQPAAAHTRWHHRAFSRRAHHTRLSTQCTPPCPCMRRALHTGPARTPGGARRPDG